jgi:hypothetical protein
VGIKSLRTFAIAGIAAGLALAIVPAASAATPHANAVNHVSGHIKSAQQSTNWSGYAKTGTFTTATATWNVPTVTTSSSNKYSSDWVGIDGYNNSNLIQTGTEQDTVGGRASYGAWWEILPASETRINMTIHPGDSMTGTITKGSGSSWTMKLTDNTSGATFSTSKSYSGPADSVEYIQEATEVGGTISSPPSLSKTTFSGLTANGANPNLTSSGEILLVQNGTTYYTPSAVSGGNSFSVSSR